MRIVIERIIIDQFMGVDHAEYSLNDVTHISGMNGTGKSTIATAHYWLWTDKDYNLVANPELHPMHLDESEPTVREVIRIDDKTIEVCKCQKDGRTKKEKESGKPFKVKNTYEINSVPMTQSNFYDGIEERGVNLNDFLLLSHPDVFTAQKSADCRKLLFKMSENKTDKEIADIMPECAELAKLLESYNTDEVTAIYKRQKSQGKEELDSIPQKIIGMEQSKQDVDTAVVSAKAQRLEASLSMAQEEFENIVIPDKSSLKEQIDALREDDRRKARMLIEDAERDYFDAKCKYDNSVSEYESVKRVCEYTANEITDKKVNLDRMLKEYESLKTQKFPESSTICPTCGQTFPEGKVAEAKENWQKDHDKRVAVMKEDGNRLAKAIKCLEKDQDGNKAKLDQCEAECRSSSTVMKEAEAKYNELRAVMPESTNADKIAELQKKIDSINEVMQTKRDKKTQIVGIQAEIKECERELAKEDFNKNVDAKIEDLKGKQKQYAQAIADAEKILYQLSLLSQKKNELLEDSVNAHFPEFIRFKLFDYLKNGEVKDACIPMVLDNGEWKDFNSAANNGLKVLAKIGILRGIQKFFDAYYPIFLDNAECLDSKTKQRVLEGAETQIIFLTVNESPTLTISKM